MLQCSVKDAAGKGIRENGATKGPSRDLMQRDIGQLIGRDKHLYLAKRGNLGAAARDE